MTWEIRNCDVLDGLRAMPDGSVHCVVTSPPYWGLRDYQVAGQIGLEKSPDEYLAKMVEVFREVRRVMRSDATLWLNVGDSYTASGGAGVQGKHGQTANRVACQNGARERRHERRTAGLKPKDLCGMPWRLAFALQADGWWLRSEIIWAKRSPMPESVADRPTKAHEQIFLLTKNACYFYDAEAAKEPGASPEVTPEEYAAAIEASPSNWYPSVNRPPLKGKSANVIFAGRCPPGGRNMRTVWTLSTEAFPGAHFATFPTELVRRCLLAGTSERGCCPTCGAPWRRALERQRRATRPGQNTKISIPGGWAVGEKDHSAIGYARADEDGEKKPPRRYAEPAPNAQAKSITHRVHHDPNIVGNRDPGRHVSETITTGWQPGCDHGGDPIPCLVLDPFSGAGTTVMVARRMHMRAIGIELSPVYAEMSRKRIVEDAPLLNAEVKP